MNKIRGVGLGFRRDIADETIALSKESNPILKPDFVELAPENWIDMGGYWRDKLEQIAANFPISAHGLSLSIGSPDELDIPFLKKIKSFLNEFNIQIYSEHLSYSKCDNAHLYDLLPIPFTEDAVNHVIERIKQVQDILEMHLVIENVSYYTPLAPKISESEFIKEIVTRSGCKMLLDINNVYVNAFNHNYNEHNFIDNLPLNEVAYMHIAGHDKISDDLIIDTHGQPIIEPVYDLLNWSLPKLPEVPILLERDFNIPNMESLQKEIQQIKELTSKHWNKIKVNA